MTTQTVRTWFRDGTELQGSPGVFSNCGFETVEQMRSELRQGGKVMKLDNDFESLVVRAVKGLKSLKGFRNHSDEAHSMNCTLAGRVMQVFGVGMTRAVRLCNLAGENPDYYCAGRRKTK